MNIVKFIAKKLVQRSQTFKRYDIRIHQDQDREIPYKISGNFPTFLTSFPFKLHLFAFVSVKKNLAETRDFNIQLAGCWAFHVENGDVNRIGKSVSKYFNLRIFLPSTFLPFSVYSFDFDWKNRMRWKNVGPEGASWCDPIDSLDQTRIRGWDAWNLDLLSLKGWMKMADKVVA